MQKKFIFLTAIVFFSTGSILLYKAKNKIKNSSIHFFVDDEIKCDEKDYLETERSSLTNDEYNELKEEFFQAKESLKHILSSGEFFVKDGESLFSILSALGVSNLEIDQLSKGLLPHLRAKDINALDSYSYEFDSNKGIKSFFITKINQERVPVTYMINKDMSGINYKLDIYKPNIKESLDFISLPIKSSLFATFNEIEYGTDLMQRFIDIFFWTLNPKKEVSKGDVLEILAVKKFINDSFIGYGKIISATYKKNSSEVFALRFLSKDKKINGVFDINGFSLEKEFLASPVQESTLTSLQKYRLHPVRKIRIPHNGTDYRGTIGTPFFALADGLIIEKGFDKNAGNLIRVQHKYGVFSEYFHADSLNEKLKVNSKVKKGEFLGNIGRTGRLCTGPHLHLGIYKNINNKKKYISLSSLKKVLLNAKNVPESYKNEFDKQKDEILANIEEMRAKKIMVAEQL